MSENCGCSCPPGQARCQPSYNGQPAEHLLERVSPVADAPLSKATLVAAAWAVLEALTPLNSLVGPGKKGDA